MSKVDTQKYIQEVQTSISSAKNENDLTNLWRDYLGKNGKLKDLLSKIKDVEPAERKEYGSTVNNLRNDIDELINSAKENLKLGNAEEYLKKTKQELDYKKAKVGHLHPLTETINEINRILGRIGYSVYDGPELETYEYNFKRCNVPEDHPALDLQDTIYVSEPNVLLRTQTSSMEARALAELKPPFKIVMPGRVYRNEKVNKSNHFTFHQYQLVCVAPKVSLSELISTIEYLFQEFLGERLGGEIKTRYRNKYYPEVEPGVGPDLQCWMCGGKGCPFCKYRGYVEMGGAGIIHPNIMRMAGLDTDKWQGFAFGLGLDRWAMAKHGIEDIRTLLGGNLAYKPFVN